MLSVSERAQIVAQVVAELRAGPPVSYLTAPEALELGPLFIDQANQTVTVDGRPIVFKPREYAVLEALAVNRCRTLSREQLLDLCWPDPCAVETSNVDIMVYRIRRKLGQAAGMILTSRGYGYQLFVADAL